MGNAKKLKQPVNDTVGAIATTIEQQVTKMLPAIENKLDPKVRRRIAPDESHAWKRYGKCFDEIAKALGPNRSAIRTLFELDNCVGEIAAAQGDVSRSVALAVNSFPLSDRYLRNRPIRKLPR